MAGANLTLIEQLSAVVPTSGNTVVLFGCSTVGTAAVPIAIDPSTSVSTVLGHGPLARLATKMQRVAKRRCYAVPVTQTVAATLSAVTETPAGTGPSVTLTGTAVDTGEWAVKITLAGAVGTAKFRITRDRNNPRGATYGPELETAATYVIPDTGITVEFAAGTYVVDTLYTFESVQPGFSNADLGVAIQALLDDSTIAFQVIHVDAGHLVEAADIATLATALSAEISAAAALKKDFTVLLGGAATETDSDMKAAFPSSFVDSSIVVCARGAWTTGDAGEGSPKRSQSWLAAARAAKGRLSSDLGNHQDGPIEECAALTVDEYSAAIKLRDSRFTVLESSPGESGFFFARGLTMAAPTSQYFKHWNLRRVFILAATAARAAMALHVNADFFTKATGVLTDAEAKALDLYYTKALRQVLLDPSPAHASGCSGSVSRTNVIATTETLEVRFEVRFKGQAVSVAGTIGAAGLTEQEGA